MSGRRGLQISTFVALVLMFPCPWYLIAVGGLLPLPVIVAFGVGSPILVVSLIHALVYVPAFALLARWVGRRAGDDPRRQGVAAVGIVAGLVAISFAPIYGEGENLATGGKLVHSAWAMYRQALTELIR